MHNVIIQVISLFGKQIKMILQYYIYIRGFERDYTGG